MKIVLPLVIENLIKSFVLYKCSICKDYYDTTSFYYNSYPVCDECMHKLWMTKTYH